MLTIAKLFGKSPFASLKLHMEIVQESLDELKKLFKLLGKKNEKKIFSLSKKISNLEHLADEKKEKIRSSLPRRIFLPINRSMILELISLQDQIANKTKDIAILFTLRPLEFFSHFEKNFSLLCKKSLETCEVTFILMLELDNLLESSFGGLEADQVRKLVKIVEKKEKETDEMQYDLLKKIYTYHKFSSPSAFDIWVTGTREISALADICEKLSHRMLLLLETK